MAASTRRDLFLQVNADVTPLTAASKAGRTALLNLGSAADDVAAEVEKAFQDLGNGKVNAAAKQIERSFDNTFAAIRRNAAAVMEAPTGKAALQILDSSGAERAAAAAETQAAALRINADAAALVAQRAGQAGDAERVLAVSFEAAAQHAEQQAVAMRSQSNVMASVAAQVKTTSGAQVAANEEVAASHSRMGASGMIVEHVVRSMSDSIAAGQSPVRALTMEMGRITEAMTFYAAQTDATEGAMGKFASFMGGPWGIAMSIGVAVLVPLVAELVEAGRASDDALDKLKKEAAQTEATRIAKQQFKATLEGVTEAIHADTDATNKSIASEKTSAEQANLSAKAHLEEMVAIRLKTKAKLEDAKAELSALSSPGASDARLAPAKDETQAAVTKLNKQIADNDRLVTEAQARLQNTRIDLAVAEAARMTDPLARIKKLYDDKAHAAEDAARKEIAAGKQVTSALTNQLAEIDRERKKAVEAEQERERKARIKPNNRQQGRQIDISEAEDIIHGIGGRVTSATRSRAQQQILYDRYKAGEGPLAAKPGTSNHETGQALDIAMGGGMTLAKIRAAFEAQGVRITELLNEGDHFHVAWGKKGPSDETLEKRAQAAADKVVNEDKSYQQALGAAQQRIMRANTKVAETIEQKAIEEGFGVENARRQRNLEIRDRLKTKTLTPARARTLTNMNDQASAAEQDAIKKKLEDGQSDRALLIERDDIASKLAMLHLQLDLAETTGTRKDLAHQILADEQRLARATLDAAIAKEDDPSKKKALTLQRDNLPAEYALKGQQADRQFGGPMENYRERLKQNVGDMNEAMSGVKANALQGLENGLVGILSGTKSVAQGFKEMADQIIADLARVAIEKLLFSALGLNNTGSSSGGGFLSLLGLGKHADGGHITGPGTGRSDSILAHLSNGEFVVNAESTSRNLPLLHAINDNSLPRFANGGMVGAGSSQIYMRTLPAAASLMRAAPAAAPLVFDLRNAVMTEDLLRQMQSISAQHATQAVIGGSQMAQNDMSERSMQQIPA